MTKARGSRRNVAVLALLATAALSSVGIAGFGGEESHAVSVGSFARGAMSVPLYRGVAIPFEATVIRTPDDCRGTMAVTMTWDEEKNQVKVRLRGKNALEPHPTVTRTEGVDFFPNPIYPEKKDVIEGSYQFWIIAPSRELIFYYDATTLNVLGSEIDFDTPPANAIPVPIPALIGIGSPLFQPDASGNVDFEWSFAYDNAERGDLPGLGHVFFTFPPTNLCESNPYRYDLSTTRPYVSSPDTTNRTFGNFLQAGMAFDVTVEPAQHTPDFPWPTLISTYSNATLFGGAVPKGWIMDFDHIFANMAPGIKPWEARDTCENWVRPQHTPHINFCQLAQGGAQ